MKLSVRMTLFNFICLFALTLLAFSILYGFSRKSILTSEEEDIFRRSQAVSYTHLDVYKRQTLWWPQLHLKTYLWFPPGLFISFSFVFLDGTKKKKSKFLLFTFFEFCRGKFTIHTRTCLFVGDYEIHCTSANFIWIYLKNRISTLYRGRYFKGYCCIFNRMESQTIARKIEKKIWKIDSHVTKWYEMLSLIHIFLA